MPFRIRAILAASDLSSGAGGILHAAGSLAALTGARLHVIHAEEPRSGPGLRDPEAQESDPTFRTLTRQIEASVPPQAELTSHLVAAGRAHEVILDRARDVEADLIVLGPHRERHSGERVLGATADRLVRTSEVPCLIVPRPIDLPLRCVLVPNDLSPAAQAALDVALLWGAALRMPTATGGGTTLHVLHVASPGADAGEIEAARLGLREQVEASRKRMGGVTVLRVDEEVVADENPTEVILRSAREKAVDLLVMGTHGHGALARALIGSVSSSVSRRAECPLLLVPPGYWTTR
jgi:nucleotide-binding universal stress UspA family protein